MKNSNCLPDTLPSISIKYYATKIKSLAICRCYTLFVLNQIAFDVFRLANTKDVELRACRVRARLETFPNKSRSCISGQFQPLHGLALVVSQSLEARPWVSFQRARCEFRIGLATYVTRLRSARPDLGPEALACPRLASRAFPQPAPSSLAARARQHLAPTWHRRRMARTS